MFSFSGIEAMVRFTVRTPFHRSKKTLNSSTRTEIDFDFNSKQFEKFDAISIEEERDRASSVKINVDFGMIYRCNQNFIWSQTE